MSDCGGCKKKVTCNFIDADWFSPGSIVYCRPQVLWYLVNADIIRDGKWPIQPTGSSYTDPAIRSKAVKIPAHPAEQLAAEIDARLKKCGIEGKLLELEVQMERELSPTSWKVLNYICGWRRRKESYRQFKSRKVIKQPVPVNCDNWDGSVFGAHLQKKN